MADVPDARRRPQRLTWLAGVVFTVLYAVVLLRTAWMCDDAYVTLRTVDNLLLGYGPNWNVDARVQTYTHPLWMLVISLVSVVTREYYLTTLIVSVLCSLAAYWIVVARLATSVAAAVVSGVALALAHGYVSFSTSGLENPLSYLLIAIFALALLRFEPSRRRSLWLGLTAGLAIVNRADLALLVLPALIYDVARRRDRRVVLAALAPVAAWFMFALFYYGFLFPNSSYAKLATGLGRGVYLQQGFKYLYDAFLRETLMMAAIVVGVALGFNRLGFKSSNGSRRALAAGILLYVIYIICVGGDFMLGRFLSVPFLVAVAIAADANAFGAGPRSFALAFGAVATLAFVNGVPKSLSGPSFGTRVDRAEPARHFGVADEREYYYQNLGLLNGKPLATKPGHSLAALRRRQSIETARVRLIETAGVGGLVSGPKPYLIDRWVLGDALLARLPVSSDRWRIGHFARNLPAGYLMSLLMDENRIIDPRIHDYYTHLRRMTVGPLFARGRLGSIVWMNLRGHRAALEDAYRPSGTDEFVEFVYTDLLAGGPRILKEAAYYHCFQKQFDEVEPILRRAATLEVAYSDEYIDVILACARGHMRDDPDFSEKLLRLLSELEPDNPRPPFRLGVFLFERGQEQEALQLLELARGLGHPGAAQKLTQFQVRQKANAPSLR